MLLKQTFKIMVSIFYSKSKNQFIKSTKSEKGKVSTEVIPYEKLKEYKDIIIIKNSFNFDDNLEAYKDVFGIDIENESALYASTCFWDMIEYDENNEKKFNKISAGAKLTDEQKEKSIITVNELMKVAHPDDECEMHPLMEEIDKLNSKNINFTEFDEQIKNSLKGCTKKEVMNYIKYLETFFKNSFSSEFWNDIENYVDRIQKEIIKELFKDNDDKNKEVEIKEKQSENEDKSNMKETKASDKTHECKYSAPDFENILPSEGQRANYKAKMEEIREEIKDIHKYKMPDNNYANKLKSYQKNELAVDNAIKELKDICDKILHGDIKSLNGVELKNGRLCITGYNTFTSLWNDEVARNLFVNKAIELFGFDFLNDRFDVNNQVLTIEFAF